MGDLPTPQLGAGESHPSSPARPLVVGHGIIRQPAFDNETCLGSQQAPAVGTYVSSYHHMASPRTGFSHQGPHDMTPTASNFPDVAYRPAPFPQAVPRYQLSASAVLTLPIFQPPPHVPAYGDSLRFVMNQPFFTPQPPMPQCYNAGPMPASQGPGTMPMAQHVGFGPNRMPMNPPQPPFYYPPPSSHRPPNVPASVIQGHYRHGHSASSEARRPRSTAEGLGSSLQSLNLGPDDSGNRPSTVRGPPRKPHQSGHAIWIGNLPPQTDLMSLVHHVCKETSQGLVQASQLESLFLISRSNCAFANFKEESACLAAQKQLHESKFQSVGLVSRLRKNTVEGATGLTAPTGPAASMASTTQGQCEATQNCATADAAQGSSPAADKKGKSRANSGSEAGKRNDRFFILKSLTTDDLELSVQTGIWATQSHNEEVLNSAFKRSDNVYLIFSANKSGEYFGYARMMSEINDDPAAAIEFAPRAQNTNTLDLPKAIPTESTEFVPRGRIIDDSARGTIFWEAELDDSESGSEVSDVSGVEEERQTWGKPFKLEWLSGIKIARDGTELEPLVGRMLVGRFNAMGPSTSMVQGYAQMRAHGQ